MPKGPFTIYGFAAPAASTIASKALGSSMAISLSIFRFRAILAFLQPLINTLYLTPRWRHAALNLVIQRPRKSRFRRLRSIRALTAALTPASFASRYSRPAAPRCPFTDFRVRFFKWRLAAPFLILGISAFLCKFLILKARWRQLNDSREASLFN